MKIYKNMIPCTRFYFLDSRYVIQEKHLANIVERQWFIATPKSGITSPQFSKMFFILTAEHTQL